MQTTGVWIARGVDKGDNSCNDIWWESCGANRGHASPRPQDISHAIVSRVPGAQQSHPRLVMAGTGEPDQRQKEPRAISAPNPAAATRQTDPQPLVGPHAFTATSFRNTQALPPHSLFCSPGREGTMFTSESQTGWNRMRESIWAKSGLGV